LLEKKPQHLHTNFLYHTNCLRLHQTHTVAAGTNAKLLHMRGSREKLVEFTSKF
jgi:hypothetical protein